MLRQLDWGPVLSADFAEEAQSGTATDRIGPRPFCAIPKFMATLNHIGIAASDLPGLKKLFSHLGLTVQGAENVAEQGVKTHFIPLPKSNTQLELLEVTDPEGVVAQFIKKRGPGIHHLSFQVDSGSLDWLCVNLKKDGYRLVYDAPRKGAHAMRINFIHPGSAGGILIELMESAGPK